MEKIVVIINKDSLERGQEGNITGKICFLHNNKYFPERNWDDFVVIVLSWWVDSFQRLFKGECRQIELRFMDGPFFAKVEIKNKMEIKVDFYDPHIGEKKIASVTGPLDTFFASLNDAAMQVIEIAKEKGWHDEEITRLNKLLTNEKVR